MEVIKEDTHTHTVNDSDARSVAVIQVNIDQNCQHTTKSIMLIDLTQHWIGERLLL